jgi:uncharacterized membrane protein YeaQ/YmgE (transglycosylase-associated protein family)
MENFQFAEQVQLWANTVLVWIGFGTLVGLLARAIMPGRDPGGAVANLAMGIGGTVIGCATLTYFFRGAHVTPISPLGLVVATTGAFVLLGFYRLLRGRLISEGEYPQGSYLGVPQRLFRRRARAPRVERI